MTAGSGEREYKKKAGSSGDSRLFVLYFFEVYRDFFPDCADRGYIVVMIGVCDALDYNILGEVPIIGFITVDSCKLADFCRRREVIADLLSEFERKLIFHGVLLTFTVPSVIFQCPCCK